MDKTLCLKFLAHLHRYSGTLLEKKAILPADIGYLNNEIEVFRKRLATPETSGFDSAAVLTVVACVEAEGTGKQAADVAMLVAGRAVFHAVPVLGALLTVFGFRRQDAGEERRRAKVAEFRDRIKKLVFVVDMADGGAPAPR